VTRIAYEVPRPTGVAIRVYDVSGRLVRTLASGPAEPGRHDVLWCGRNDQGEPVGSGVYFCTMEADGFHARHKMVLLK
jgi:flagellar hook assembly protein FlgD